MIYLEDRHFDLERALIIATRPLHETFSDGGRIRVKEVMNRFRALKHAGVRTVQREHLDHPGLISCYLTTCKSLVDYAFQIDPSLARSYIARSFNVKHYRK